VEDADRFRLDGVHHLVGVGLDGCYLVVEELDDRLELCEQPVRLAQLVLVAKQMLARSAPQVQQAPHQLEQVLEPPQVLALVQVQLLRVQLVLQTGLAVPKK
jgi:hypothetical protein